MAVSLALAATAAVGGGVAGAQSAPGDSVPLEEVVRRDELIFNQEALLNVYRCLFGVDAELVPGGCVDGRPGAPAEEPAPFEGSPTVAAVAVRDHLVSDQEALLNVYRCLFDVDTQIVPGGCVDGRPFDPTAPVEATDPDGPAARPTGYTPGDAGDGWSVDGNGRVHLERLTTHEEGIDAYVAAGYPRDRAERTWPTAGEPGEIGGIRSSDGGRYQYTLPMDGVSGGQLLALAQACVSAFEDAGVPARAQAVPADGGAYHRVPAAPAGLAARCSREAHRSGVWNLVTGIYGADPQCIVGHLVEFMPVRAGIAAGRSYEDMGYHRNDLWWANHCELRVSHPLGSELVLGPFGSTDAWDDDLYDSLYQTLIESGWAPRDGTWGDTGIGLVGYTTMNGVRRPIIHGFALETLRYINSGQACWRPGTEPWTTAHLDRLGIDWYRTGPARAPAPVGTLCVYMRFLPDPHSSEHRHSAPAPAYWGFTS